MLVKRLAAGLAAMATLAAGLAGPSAYADEVTFRDVTSSTPHADDIEWTASTGISTGWLEPDGSRTFRGMDTVKRQDMAAFLRREAKRMNAGDAGSWKPSASDWRTFRDVSGSTPHAEDVLWLAHTGISTGWKESDGSRTYRGMDSVKRQDMAAFMHRLARLAGRGSNVSPKSFRDVNASTPHADDIRWLGGSKVSTGYPDGTYRGMVSVYRQDMAAFLHRLDRLNADAPSAPVRQVVPGDDAAFAVKSDGSLWAWGDNYDGQLGVGDKSEHRTPMKVTGGVSTVVSAGGSSYAVKKDGSLWAWGDNSTGTLGVGDLNDRLTPAKVMDDVSTVQHAGLSIYAVKKNGSLWAWGDNYDGQLGVGDKSTLSKPAHVMDDVSTIRTIYADGWFVFAVKTDGSLWAWGYNHDDQLGVGDEKDHFTPTHVMDGVSTVQGKYGCTYVVKKDGSLWAWGGNPYGQLGVGDRDDRLTPTHVMDDVAAVEPDGFNAFAVKKDGSLWVWGYVGDSRGMTIDVKDTQPTPVKMMDGVATVQSDDGSICAVKRDGSLWTWGYNGNGQPGLGDKSYQPTPVRMMDDVAEASAGGWSIYALKKDGSLWAWGFNHGDLGVGDRDEHATPAHVLDGVASYQGGYAVRKDGSLWAWGDNRHGRLGVGDTDERLSPVRVM